jgi:hypothetical protein
LCIYIKFLCVCSCISMLCYAICREYSFGCVGYVRCVISVIVFVRNEHARNSQKQQLLLFLFIMWVSVLRLNSDQRLSFLCLIKCLNSVNTRFQRLLNHYHAKNLNPSNLSKFALKIRYIFNYTSRHTVKTVFNF